VRLGDTAVVCGIRGEILLASDVTDTRSIQVAEARLATGSADEEALDHEAGEVDALSLLVPNIELATGCNPSHLPGNPPSQLAQTLAQRILNLLHTTRLVRARNLRILYKPPPVPSDTDVSESSQEPEVKAYWTLYIDILFMSLDGNAFDAAWVALLAALKDTRLPEAYWDAENEMILCSDSPSKAKSLDLRGLPVPATYSVFSLPAADGLETQTWVLADPDAFEEELCSETVCVVVDCSGSGKSRICKIEKSGGCVLERSTMRELVTQAEKRWTDWKEVFA